MAKKKPEPVNLSVGGPFVGVNQQNESRLIGLKEASDNSNVILDNGSIKVRDGFNTGSAAPNAAKCLGQHDYRQNDGTLIHLAVYGQQLYKISAAGAFTTIGGSTAFDGDNLVQFVTHRNRVYMTDGGTPKVTDGTSLFDWEITAPDRAPNATGVTSGGVAGGRNTGVYDYKLTFYSTTWGQESPASPSLDSTAPTTDKTSAVVLSDQFVDLSDFDTSADTRVDKYRIYRRKISAFESDWFLVDEIDDTETSYQDRSNDSQVSTTRIAPLTNTVAFPQARYIAENADVLFVAGIDTDPTAIWFTRPGETALTDKRNIDDDGAEITGLISFQSNLVIFTSRSIWILSGNTPKTFFLRKSIPDRGCLAPFSITPVDNLIYFLSEAGFFAYNLNQVAEISREVQPIICTRNFSLDKLVVGMHDWQNNAVWWNYPDSGSSKADQLLVYHYRNTSETGARSWSRMTMGNMVHMAQITDSVTKIRKIKLGFFVGNNRDYTGTTDDGTAIAWSWTTGKIDVGSPTISKHWDQMMLEFTRATSGNVDVEVAVDDSDIFTMVGDVHDLTEEIMWLRVGRWSRNIRFRFSGSSTAGTELFGWSLGVARGVRSS